MPPFSKLFAKAALAWALSMVAVPVLAEDWQGLLLEREVGMTIPADFVAEPAFADASDEAAIVEFLPAGQTLEVWSQMLTLTSFVDPSGLTADQAALKTANNLAEGYGSACPGTFAAEDLGAPALPGADASFSAWLSCGEVMSTGQAESMVVLVLVAEGRVYSVQWAERGPASAAPLVFNMADWLPRMDALMAFRL